MPRSDINQGSINLKPSKINQESVDCLNLTFENDEKRRTYYNDKLSEKLNDPVFRNLEGFPVADDLDILELSDPPYYTACPNPFLRDFLEQSKESSIANGTYKKEPFTTDVSEGKNDPIYNAHSYHTKVPHKAIMRYILHYTEPGDIVYDSFTGTGMTGVAAQLCGDKNVVKSLGYKVNTDGTILRKDTNGDEKDVWVKFSKLGSRIAVLNDLSPAATFIAHILNAPINPTKLKNELLPILKEYEQNTKWMWETLHSDGATIGLINYIVWSDVYSCAECSQEFVYYDEAFSLEEGKYKFNPEFKCPHCHSLISKSPSAISSAQKPDRVWESMYDSLLGKVTSSAKRVPVSINYRIGTKRYSKKVTIKDMELISKIKELDYNSKYLPTSKMKAGDKTGDPFSAGVKYVHQFYTHRILQSISQLLQDRDYNPLLVFLLGSALPKLTIMNRYMPQHGGRALVGPMANTLYVPPVSVENNVIDQLWFQLKKIAKAVNLYGGNIISTQGAQCIQVPDNSADYVFLDPPFGANIMYSELSFIRESWLKVFTNALPEAIENKTQKKSINDYRVLMTKCFSEAYRILKPGRWATVEFSNTKASVWNSIQNALSDAGFIVATVTALDKTRGGFHSMIGPTAVKQDLIISAYKPNGGFEQRFSGEAHSEEGVWDFIRTHLKYLPIIKKQDGDLILIAERDPRILFDQLVAYYVRKGYQVPISSKEFQLGLAQRFSAREGMYFLSDQAAEYDKKRMTLNEVKQLELFVSDEASSIQWLKQKLIRKPQSFQKLNPLFMKEISGWHKYEKPLELSELLEQNFLRYEGRSDVPSQIHSYLSTNYKELRSLLKSDYALVAKAKDRWYVPDPNKANDLEKLRERKLLREFWEYLPYGYKPEKPETLEGYLPGFEPKTTPVTRGTMMKIFRMEAVRAGFKVCWQSRDYRTIITVAQRIPEKILQEDPKLLMWYDQALTRTGVE